MTEGPTIYGAKGKVADPQTAINILIEHFKENNLKAQAVDSRAVLNRTHIDLAYQQASRRFSSGNGICRTLELEFLLYLTGTHQISVALDRAGLNETTEELLFIVFEGDSDLSGLLEKMELQSAEVEFRQDPEDVLKRFEVEGSLWKGLSKDEQVKTVYELMAMVNLEK